MILAIMLTAGLSFGLGILVEFHLSRKECTACAQLRRQLDDERVTNEKQRIALANLRVWSDD